MTFSNTPHYINHTESTVEQSFKTFSISTLQSRVDMEQQQRLKKKFERESAYVQAIQDLAQPINNNYQAFDILNNKYTAVNFYATEKPQFQLQQYQNLLLSTQSTKQTYFQTHQEKTPTQKIIFTSQGQIMKYNLQNNSYSELGQVRSNIKESQWNQKDNDQTAAIDYQSGKIFYSNIVKQQRNLTCLQPISSKTGNTFVTSGEDGKIITWEVDQQNNEIKIINIIELSDSKGNIGVNQILVTAQAIYAATETDLLRIDIKTNVVTQLQQNMYKIIGVQQFLTSNYLLLLYSSQYIYIISNDQLLPYIQQYQFNNIVQVIQIQQTQYLLILTDEHIILFNLQNKQQQILVNNSVKPLHGTLLNDNKNLLITYENQSLITYSLQFQQNRALSKQIEKIHENNIKMQNISITELNKEKDSQQIRQADLKSARSCSLAIKNYQQAMDELLEELQQDEKEQQEQNEQQELVEQLQQDQQQVSEEIQQNKQQEMVEQLQQDKQQDVLKQDQQVQQADQKEEILKQIQENHQVDQQQELKQDQQQDQQ